MNKKICGLWVLILLSACGQKGALYLPQTPGQESQPDKTTVKASDTLSDHQ